MNVPRQRIVHTMLAVVAFCLAAVFATHRQSLAQFGGGAPQGQAQSTSSPAAMDAERAQIWNSPNMLQARAWLLRYCQTSAKVKPGDAQKFMTELENMTPAQMQLWLMKFDEEEQAKQQQQALWKQAHSAALSQAMAANRATQQSYTAIEQEETQSAGEEQQQLNIQQADEQEMAADKQLGPVSTSGYDPGDGVHYH